MSSQHMCAEATRLTATVCKCHMRSADLVTLLDHFIAQLRNAMVQLLLQQCYSNIHSAQ